MKKLVILAILIVSNIAFAGPVPERKALELHEARAKNVESKETKEYLEAVRKGKATPTMKATIVRLLQGATAKVGGVDSMNLELITAIRPETLDKVTQLISHVNYGTVEQKAKASADLRILSDGAKYVNTKADAEVLEKVTQMSDYNEAAKKFKAELIKTLSMGKAKSIEEAIKIASNGKITLEKIKECII